MYLFDTQFVTVVPAPAPMLPVEQFSIKKSTLFPELAKLGEMQFLIRTVFRLVPLSVIPVQLYTLILVPVYVP
jgi:hypothetical protein